MAFLYFKLFYISCYILNINYISIFIICIYSKTFNRMTKRGFFKLYNGLYQVNLSLKLVSCSLQQLRSPAGDMGEIHPESV